MPRSNREATAADAPVSEPVVVRVPLRFRRRGGRKLVLVDATSDGAPAKHLCVDPALVKALARAFRWQQKIDDGGVVDINELAQAKGLSPTYVGRVLRLTLLAPELVEQILDGEDLPGLTPAAMKGGVPNLWESQRWNWAWCSEGAVFARGGYRAARN